MEGRGEKVGGWVGGREEEDRSKIGGMEGGREGAFGAYTFSSSITQ